MTQWIKAFATQNGELGSTPRTHIKVEKEN